MTAGALADTEVREPAAGAGVAETAEVGVAGSFLPVFFASLAYDMSLFVSVWIGRSVVIGYRLFSLDTLLS
jgi:hypothetical protein